MIVQSDSYFKGRKVLIDRRLVMKCAWRNFRDARARGEAHIFTFAVCLRRAWDGAKYERWSFVYRGVTQCDIGLTIVV